MEQRPNTSEQRENSIEQLEKSSMQALISMDSSARFIDSVDSTTEQAMRPYNFSMISAAQAIHSMDQRRGSLTHAVAPSPQAIAPWIFRRARWLFRRAPWLRALAPTGFERTPRSSAASQMRYRLRDGVRDRGGVPRPRRTPRPTPSSDPDVHADRALRGGLRDRRRAPICIHGVSVSELCLGTRSRSRNSVSELGLGTR